MLDASLMTKQDDAPRQTLTIGTLSLRAVKHFGTQTEDVEAWPSKFGAPIFCGEPHVCILCVESRHMEVSPLAWTDVTMVPLRLVTTLNSECFQFRSSLDSIRPRPNLPFEGSPLVNVNPRVEEIMVYSWPAATDLTLMSAGSIVTLK